MIGKTPSSLFPGGWQGSQIILRGWGKDEGEENTVNLSPLARVWTSGAVWLHSVAVGGATKATTEAQRQAETQRRLAGLARQAGVGEIHLVMPRGGGRPGA